MATSALPPSVSFTITAEDYANALRLRMRRSCQFFWRARRALINESTEISYPMKGYEISIVRIRCPLIA